MPAGSGAPSRPVTTCAAVTRAAVTLSVSCRELAGEHALGADQHRDQHDRRRQRGRAPAVGRQPGAREQPGRAESTQRPRERAAGSPSSQRPSSAVPRQQDAGRIENADACSPLNRSAIAAPPGQERGSSRWWRARSASCRPPARQRARRPARRPRRRAGRLHPRALLDPTVAALGMGVGIAQPAVVAAARRAGKVRPAEAPARGRDRARAPRRRAHAHGVIALGGGAAMALLFKGEQASAFSILAGILLAGGTALLGRWLLGLPVGRARGPAALHSARPGCSRAPGSRPTAGAAPRSRRRSC